MQNNNNGVIYDSAELKFDELLDGVAQSVKDNNSLYSSKSLEDIKSEWGVQIRGPPTGEVKNNWTPSLNNGTLN